MPSAGPVAQVGLRSLLDLDEIRSGRPEVVNGADRLDRLVRWVHVADSEGVGALIEGGELVLSTAAGFRTSVSRVRRFLEDLEGGHAAAALFELVEDDGSPDDVAVATVRAAVDGLDLPVVVLRRRIKFVRVTQAAHRLLIGEQLARVERSRHVHEVFTQLNLEAADEQRIVETTARLVDGPVLLEDVAHRVLTRAGSESEPGGARSTYPGWSVRSEEAQVAVGAGGRVWGRLVAPRLDPTDRGAMQVLERAAQALALTRMAVRDQADLLERARAGFLQALMSAGLTEDEALARATELGLADADVYVPVVVHLAPGRDEGTTQLLMRERALLEGWLADTRPLVGTVVAAGLRTGSFALLLGLRRGTELDEVLARLVSRVRSRDAGGWTVGVGPHHALLTRAAAGVEEAAQVARTAAMTQTRELPFYRFADVRLRGLVALLADDPNLRTFAEAELGPLLAGSPAWGLDLLELYLRHGGNKSRVARAAHLSRQALYARLRRLEDALGVSLDDPESRSALHVALLWTRLHSSG